MMSSDHFDLFYFELHVDSEQVIVEVPFSLGIFEHFKSFITLSTLIELL